MAGSVTPAAIYTNPMILAMAAGVLCVAGRIPLPSLVTHTLGLMNTATFPLSMVVVGGGLRLRFLIDPGRIAQTVLGSTLKLFLSPLIAWGICLALGLKDNQTAVCVLQAAMPTAVLVTIFSVKYEADAVFSNAIVSLTTLAIMGTIPLLFFLLRLG